MGEFVDVKYDAEGTCVGKFLRIRVRIYGCYYCFAPAHGGGVPREW